MKMNFSALVSAQWREMQKERTVMLIIAQQQRVDDAEYFCKVSGRSSRGVAKARGKHDDSRATLNERKAQ